MREVIKGLKREHDGQKIPCIVFTKGGGLWLDELADSGADAVGLDWTVNLGKARQQVGHKVALQGNLDPNVLFAKPDQIHAEVEKVLNSFGKPSSNTGHVFNLGHGISQFTPPENVSVLMETAHDISAKYKTAKIMIMPNKGKGLIAGSSARTILNLAGVNDVTSKFFSKTKNKLNNARVTMKALEQIAYEHGKAPVKKVTVATEEVKVDNK